MVKSYTYDAFGVEQNPSDSDTNPFRYCGEYYDSEIEQIYLRARYYDPVIGRFTQQDTHWTPENMIYGDYNINIPDVSAIMQSNNLYVYCSSNPVNCFDPTGDYNREGAVAYALKYGGAGYLSGQRNDYYYNYRTNCANFVSQCLAAGGIKYNSSWYSHRNSKNRIVPSFWNNDNYDWDVAEPWRLAAKQFEYFSDASNGYIWGDVLTIKTKYAVKTAADYWGIQPGDLLYVSDDYGNVTHAMIVTKVENGEIYYAGNTDEKVDARLSENMGNNQIKVIRIRNEAEYGYKL